MRVLVVEDERRMARYVSRALAQEAFAVEVAHDGLHGLDMAMAYDYDAVVLDLMLPGLDGLRLCQRLRQAGRQTPILVISARDMVEDRVRVLDAGADDYLVKPFSLEELAARLRAIQRRQARAGAGPILTCADLELDPLAHAVRRGGQAVSLTAREYALLECFMRRPGRVLTRAMISEHVWDFAFDPDSNVVDVHVKHLRDKLDLPGRPSVIRTVRGVGYVLGDPAAPA